VVFWLRAVSDKPETADHLTNSKKANYFSSYNSDRHPFCAGHASYLVEHVGGLHGAGLGGTGEEACRVTGGFHDGLEVALNCGHVTAG
jgi:hypothetical protein